MNILFLAMHDFKPRVGGISEMSYQIALHLHKAGDHVIALSKTMEGDREFDAQCPFPIYRIPIPKAYGKRVLGGFWSIHKKIKQLCHEHSIDLIFCNLLVPQGSICWLSSKILKLPYYILVYGNEMNLTVSRTRRWNAKLGIRSVSKVYGCSDYSRRLAVSLGVPENRTASVYPGISDNYVKAAIDIDRFAIREKYGLGNNPLLLTVGRLVARKGIDTTLQAIAHVRDRFPNIRYLIAGDGPYRSDLEKMVTELKIENQVIFTGRFTEEEKPFLYAACDIFVMPNRKIGHLDVEGFGVVFLEANAHGKPVIAGNSGGAVEAVQDGQTGLVVDSENVDAVASAIIQLLENPELCQQLGTAGRNRVVNRLNWYTVVRDFREDLFNDFQDQKNKSKE